MSRFSHRDLDVDPEALQLMMRAQEIPSCKWAEAEDARHSGARRGSPSSLSKAGVLLWRKLLFLCKCFILKPEVS